MDSANDRHESTRFSVGNSAEMQWDRNTTTIFCINSTNSCNFRLLVDFLHHPTFPPRRKLRGFFCLTRTRRGQLQIVSMAQTLSRVVSDSNSGLITNSP